MGKALPIIGTVGGGVVGAYFGGPQGAALGASIGGGLGTGAAGATGAFAPKIPKPITPVNPLDTGAGNAQLAQARAAAVDQEQRRSLLGATVAGQGAAPAAGSIGTKTLLGS